MSVLYNIVNYDNFFSQKKSCFASFFLLGCVLLITEYSTSCDNFIYKENDYSKAMKNNEEETMVWLR